MTRRFFREAATSQVLYHWCTSTWRRAMLQRNSCRVRRPARRTTWPCNWCFDFSHLPSTSPSFGDTTPSFSLECGVWCVVCGVWRVQLRHAPLRFWVVGSIRYTSAEMLGIVNVRLTLLYNTILFISREPFRKVGGGGRGFISSLFGCRVWRPVTLNSRMCALPVHQSFVGPTCHDSDEDVSR
jgi:hypothetical protein